MKGIWKENKFIRFQFQTFEESCRIDEVHTEREINTMQPVQTDCKTRRSRWWMAQCEKNLGKKKAMKPSSIQKRCARCWRVVRRTLAIKRGTHHFNRKAEIAENADDIVTVLLKRAKSNSNLGVKKRKKNMEMKTLVTHQACNVWVLRSSIAPNNRGTNSLVFKDYRRNIKSVRQRTPAPRSWMWEWIGTKSEKSVKRWVRATNHECNKSMSVGKYDIFKECIWRSVIAMGRMQREQ